MPASSAARPFLVQVVDNLIAGVALALGRGDTARATFGGTAHFLLAVLAAWLLVLGISRLATGAGAALWDWGVAVFAARFYFWLLVVGAVAWLLGAPARATELACALLYAGAPVFVFIVLVLGISAALGVGEDAGRGSWLWFAVLFWLAAILVRTIIVLGFAPRRRRLLAASALYAGFGPWLAGYLPSAALHYTPVASEYTAPRDVEAIYYRQQHLVRQQLDALAPADSSRVEAYAVTFAPYASEDVFLRESRGATRVFEQRFGLAGRTVALINHSRTASRLPLANAPNLAATLRGLGAIMNPEQDILILFLTSHGERDASLAAEFDDVLPNDLHAGALRRMLDDAGIRHRVVIVSACFSGSFIAPLKTPHTLVMTAAAADRTSFGCAHENEWTYFGRALFDEALREQDNFIAAFDVARERIAAREKEEKKPPSRPQIVVGAGIGAQLTRWASDRDAGR